MELVLFNLAGEYVGSVFSKNSQPPPEVVIFASGDVHQAYVAQEPVGVRAGGIPRYVFVRSIVTTQLQQADHTPTPRERQGRQGRRRR